MKKNITLRWLRGEKTTQKTAVLNYIEQYKILHETSPSYGASAIKYMPEVCLCIDYLKPKTVLDFGCGKVVLIKELQRHYPDITFYGYDPAIPGRDTLPVEKADLLINTDVLEHIPTEMVAGVVEKMASISNNVFVVMFHALASELLPNGENAHCTIKPPQWYYELFNKYFETPYPLPGRKCHLSAIISFKPTAAFLKNYHKTVAEPGILAKIQREIKRALWKMIGHVK